MIQKKSREYYSLDSNEHKADKVEGETGSVR